MIPAPAYRLLAGLRPKQAQQAVHALGLRGFVDRELDVEFLFQADNQFDLRKTIPPGKIPLRMLGTQLQSLVFEHFPENTLEADEGGMQGVVCPVGGSPLASIYHTAAVRGAKPAGVGQEGILRPIGNRPASALRNCRKAGYQPAAGWQPAPPDPMADGR